MKLNENDMFNRMIEQAEEIYFVYNIKEKRFLSINAAFEKITQRSGDELMKDPSKMYDLIHKEDLEHITYSFNLLLKNRSASLLDFRICRADEVQRWIRLKVYPILENDEVRYITGVAEDDSARTASIFNMQKVNGWKDSTLEIVSHDLRGPIGIVNMLATAIAGKLPEKDNKQVHQWIKMIKDISNRNLELIKMLLKRELMDTADVEISKERLDMVWEINQVMDIYLKAQNTLNKQFRFTHSHETLFAEVDSMKFLQIVNNLVSNAMKFTKEDAQIKLHLEKLEKTALLTISDNGIGIPKSMQPILFNKYTKAGRDGLAGEQSVGLGMWIVKALTEAHGGRVWFESEENKGSKFYVEIPIRR